MQEPASAELAEPVLDYPAAEQRPYPAVPEYLKKVYWWAYLHPRGVRIFEHQWIVNAILWGNFVRLRDSALDEMGSTISGRSLQVACVYGDFTGQLAQRLAPGASLDVVDVAPIQLQNLRRKIGVAEGEPGLPERRRTCLRGRGLRSGDGVFSIARTACRGSREGAT